MTKFPSAVFVVIVILGGCAGPSSSVIKTPSGVSVTRINCNIDSAGCFNEAQTVCGGSPYQVVNSWSNAGGTLADIIPGPVTWYHMDIVCGYSNGEMPSFPFKGQSYRPPVVTNCKASGSGQVYCTTY